MSNSYALVTQSRYISQMICSSIVSAMALFVLLIALIVIASNIINYIQVNMKDLGALKAVGYTSGQLVRSLLAQFLRVALAAALAGVGLSYALFPGLNAMMIQKTGIPYAMRFLPLPFALTLTILGGAVALAVCAGRPPYAENRAHHGAAGGAVHPQLQAQPHPAGSNERAIGLGPDPQDHPVRDEAQRHHCRYYTGALPGGGVFRADAGKHDLGHGALHQPDRGGDGRFLHQRPGGRGGRVSGGAAGGRPGEKAYLYNSVTVGHVDGVELLATMCDDFSKLNNQGVVFDGRFPKFDNEVAVAAKYAREQGLAIGDEMELTSNSREASYLITGFTQITNNLGKDCLLTRAGYERLGALANTSYYLHLLRRGGRRRF